MRSQIPCPIADIFCSPNILRTLQLQLDSFACLKLFTIKTGLASAWAAPPIRIRSQPVHPFIRASLPCHGREYDIGGLFSSHFDKKQAPAFDDVHQPAKCQSARNVLGHDRLFALRPRRSHADKRKYGEARRKAGVPNFCYFVSGGGADSPPPGHTVMGRGTKDPHYRGMLPCSGPGCRPYGCW